MLHLYGQALCALLLLLTPLAWLHPALGALRPWQLGLHVLLGAGLWWRRREPLWQQPVARSLRWAFYACALAWLVSAQLHRYWALEVNGFDFSIFDWMLHNTWRGRFMYSPIYGVNHLGVHPTYVLFPLLPLHRLVQSPLLLSMVTAVAVWAGLWPLWRLGVRLLGSEPLALLSLVAYLTNPWLGRLVDGGFRPEVLFPPVGLWLVWAWVERRPGHWVAALVTFLCIKEDAAFYTSAWAVGSLWLEPERRREAGGMLVASLGLLVVNVGWVQPLMLAGWNAGQPAYVRFWGQYGSTLREIVANMARAPWRPVWDVVTSHWYKMFGPLLLLPLLGRVAVFPMLPTVLLLGSASYGLMHKYRTYYPVPLLPFVFWGLMEAYVRLGGWGRLGRWREGLVCAALLVFPLVGSGDVSIPRPDWELRRNLEQVRARLAGWEGPVCTPSGLFPQMPYTLELQPLTPECLEQAGSVTVLHPEIRAWPYPKEQIQTWIEEYEARGQAEHLPGGFVLLRGR